MTEIAVGDRVIVSCISACGKCGYCLEGMYSHCLADEGAPGIGWILGHLIDGTQAEYVRVPFAETSLHKVPEGVAPEEAAMISDILPTGHEIGIRYGAVKPGDVVAIIGAGPVGLAAMTTAALYGPSRVIAIDIDANRVEQAKRFGASDGVVSSDSDWKEQVIALTDGLGVDVAIEAVGVPATWDMSLAIVRPGRPRRQRRRARQAGELPARDGVDPEPHDHHRTRQHRHLSHAHQAARAGKTRRGRLHQPPLLTRGHHERLRHLRPRGGDEGAQGDPHGVIAVCRQRRDPGGVHWTSSPYCCPRQDVRKQGWQPAPAVRRHERRPSTVTAGGPRLNRPPQDGIASPQPLGDSSGGLQRSTRQDLRP